MFMCNINLLRRMKILTKKSGLLVLKTQNIAKQNVDLNVEGVEDIFNHSKLVDKEISSDKIESARQQPQKLDEVALYYNHKN